MLLGDKSKYTYVVFFRNLVCVFGFSAILLFLFSSTSNAASRQMILGQIPKDEARSTKMERLQPDQTLKLRIYFSVRNQSIYDNFFKDIHGHHISWEELQKTCGPIPLDIQAVDKYFGSKGLEVSRNKYEISDVSVSGKVIDIEKAFHVRLYNYCLPEGKVFYAPDNEPLIDLDVPVLHIQGLDNDMPPHTSHSLQVNYEY